MKFSENNIFPIKPYGTHSLRDLSGMNSARTYFPREKSSESESQAVKSSKPGFVKTNLSGIRLTGTLLFLLFTVCILTHSELSLSYAALGLKLWFEKMIPSLLPFMILSGIVIRLGLTETIASFVYPLIRPLYRVRKNVCYCMMLGFLCGFPMGARVVADLYSREQLTREEGEYLLAFCNNIGPVYYCSFVLPLLRRELIAPYLFGMYGIPALYGIFLRYTRYRDLGKLLSSGTILTSTCYRSQEKQSHRKLFVRRGERLLSETDQSINASIRSILTLGGYMILFNLLNLIPHVLWGRQIPLPAPLFEITGGLSLLQAQAPLYSLLALSFGGFSCMAQTYSCIRETDLSIVDYILHKIILTLLNALFYFSWFLLSPMSFLR